MYWQLMAQYLYSFIKTYLQAESASLWRPRPGARAAGHRTRRPRSGCSTAPGLTHLGSHCYSGSHTTAYLYTIFGMVKIGCAIYKSDCNIWLTVPVSHSLDVDWAVFVKRVATSDLQGACQGTCSEVFTCDIYCALCRSVQNVVSWQQRCHRLALSHEICFADPKIHDWESQPLPYFGTQLCF